jgi:N-sulfoglucosamine sulfohydrolase
MRVPAHLPTTRVIRADLADYANAVARCDFGVGAVLDELAKAGHRDDTLVIFISDNGIPFPGAKTNVYDAGIHLPLLVRVPGSKAGVVSKAMVSSSTSRRRSSSLPARPRRKTCRASRCFPIVAQDDAPGPDVVFASHVFHEITMYYPMRAIRTRTHKLIWNLASPLAYPIAADISARRAGRTILQSGAMGGRTREGYLHRPPFELYDLAKEPMN